MGELRASEFDEALVAGEEGVLADRRLQQRLEPLKRAGERGGKGLRLCCLGLAGR